MRKLLMISCAAILASCGDAVNSHTSEAKVVAETVVQDVLDHPDWAKNATIYEVNVRQHTPEGTFKAFEKDIERIAKLGTKILWLMPIHPIGEENRKGGKGSYYSVKDYQGVNPEFGTLQDFKDLVETAHSFGLKVIIDWVANHSAFDNVWAAEHKDWYVLDSLGNLQPPVADWSDVADLNFDNLDMQEAMIEAMEYWLNETNIDGYRCDVAMMVPMPFWNKVRKRLDAIKPVFMLAEAEGPEFHEDAFDMTYAWEFMHILNGLAKQEKTLADLDAYLEKEKENYPLDAYRMSFTTNHDENSWNGTVFERYGDANQLYATLAFTLHGMPLVYSGQEAGLDKRLAFFEKDTVDWKNYPLQDFYSKLLKANNENEALWNGVNGGEVKRLKTNNDNQLFAFSRAKGKDEIVVILNFGERASETRLLKKKEGDFLSIFDDRALSVYTSGNAKLGPYGFQVFAKKN